jgi:hypothetical protein
MPLSECACSSWTGSHGGRAGGGRGVRSRATSAPGQRSGFDAVALVAGLLVANATLSSRRVR